MWLQMLIAASSLHVVCYWCLSARFSSVRACVNAYMLHSELFVFHSKLQEAPAVSGPQLHVNDFVTIFI